MNSTTTSRNPVSKTPKVFENGPTLSFYKPNKQNTGSAMFLEFDRPRSSISMRMIPQAADGGDKKFNSDKRIQASLGLIDIGNILAVLEGRLKGLGPSDGKGGWKGLYHENPNGYSVISMFEGEKGIFFGLSSKRKDSEAIRYGMGLTIGEEILLAEFLRKYLGEMFNDQGVKQVAAIRSTQNDKNENPDEPGF